MELNSTKEKGNTKRTKNYWTLLLLLVLLGGIAGSWTFYQKSQSLQAINSDKGEVIRRQTATIEAIRNGNFGMLIDDVISGIEEQVKGNPNGIVSSNYIDKIAKLSFSLKPYDQYDGDSISATLLSPERGQLLLLLTTLQMDSCSFDTVKQISSFAHSDLRSANLRETDLSGINLSGADLRNANLAGTDLRNTDLSHANLWGANLMGAKLDQSDLTRTNFSWAQIRQASLKDCKGNGALFDNTQLLNSDLSSSSFKWASFQGAMLNNARLFEIDLFEANMTKANMAEVDIRSGRLRSAVLDQVILTGANLNDVEVGDSWFTRLREWQVVGSDDIELNYEPIELENSTDESKKFGLKLK